MTLSDTVPVLRELRLRNFRNFEDVHLVFPAAGAAVIGDNGSGKTNLLEAIYYLEIFRSFRGSSDDQLVRFGAEAFHIRGVFYDPVASRDLEITAAYESKTRTKRVRIDGVEQERLVDAIGRVAAVIFSPSDVELVSGGPAERRRYLDILLSLSSRGYLEALQRYRHALRQRNAVLRGFVNESVTSAFEPALVAAGAVIMTARAKWVSEHADRFAELYAEIGGGAAAQMRYSPDVAVNGPMTEATAAVAFEQALARVARRERERRVTLAGPHRDDLSFLMAAADGDVDLREFGSGGQRRTGAIALRLVEAATIRGARSRQPVMLLDDVFAELDAGRSSRIVQLFREGRRGQVVMTAPKETDVELAPFDDRDSAPARWGIAAGSIRA
ncbi:MAG: DNA replication and repair protein RecF [Longimicrobiales bacterium]